MPFEKEYHQRLMSLADEEYYHFKANMVPGVKQIGIRIPVLRKIAKEYSQTDYQKYLDLESIYNEEKLIKGLIIGYLKIDFSEVLKLLDDFLPEIDAWDICDVTVSNLKIFKKHLGEGLAFVDKCLKSKHTFSIRFGLVLLLSYYIKEEYLDYIIQVLSNLQSNQYYVQMAAAWLISYLYIKFPNETIVLFDGRLDKFTHNKAISKIRESYRVQQKDKDDLLKFRR
ncbi:MAG: DNA alkylation repair protein [Bacilli bacterium]|nr:DNA alkylation repair protein [Bacilli bacterium]